ncbi:hypothetical protein NC653_039154 [Populus alba x Populus x berolinensis]|uniref:Uncharacterized protein n=1 Tax=Populus alba x Populus x berolinensis TaxID=444605 RepID=A0AAD6LD53_9ROSI|nr:hypothetical protein NC653_039154 [Populus alba x Populus x berolinensis]
MADLETKDSSFELKTRCKFEARLSEMFQSEVEGMYSSFNTKQRHTLSKKSLLATFYHDGPKILSAIPVVEDGRLCIAGIGRVDEQIRSCRGQLGHYLLTVSSKARWSLSFPGPGFCARPSYVAERERKEKDNVINIAFSAPTKSACRQDRKFFLNWASKETSCDLQDTKRPFLPSN